MQAIIGLIVSCFITLSSSYGENFFASRSLVEGREKCLEENSLISEDLRTVWRRNETIENFFCFQRCMLVVKGVLGENFEVRGENLGKLLRTPRLGEEQKEEIVECLNEVEKVEKCEDTKKIFECTVRKRN